MRRPAMPTMRGPRPRLKPANPAARAMQSVRAKFDSDGPDAALVYGQGIGFTDEELTREIARWTAETAVGRTESVVDAPAMQSPPGAQVASATFSLDVLMAFSSRRSPLARGCSQKNGERPRPDPPFRAWRAGPPLEPIRRSVRPPDGEGGFFLQ